MDTYLSENTSEIPVEPESLGPPPELIPVRRSERTTHEDNLYRAPEGYVNPRYSNRVFKLKESIYGLKQALRQWNKRFDEEIKKFRIYLQNHDEAVCIIRNAMGVMMHKADVRLLKLGPVDIQQNQKAHRVAVKHIQNVLVIPSLQCDKDDYKVSDGYSLSIEDSNWKARSRQLLRCLPTSENIRRHQKDALEAVRI
ncbi:retrotransposon protein, putative, ty1-copia subclass [Tanacetum coccineum]